MYSRWKLRFGQDRKDKDLKLVILWKVSCTFLLSNKLENLNKFLAPYLWMDEPIRSIISYEARMWHQRCHTRVRRGRTRRRVGDAATPVSRHVDFMYFSPTCADASQRGSDTGRFARYQADSGLNRPYWLYQPKRPIQAEIQPKKKKGAERTVWLISKPYFSPISHKHQNISSSPHIDLDDEEVGVWLSYWLSFI